MFGEIGKISISVIIPFYNDSGTISRALSSLRYQRLKSFEVILVDDASANEEFLRLTRIVEDFSELKVRIIRQEMNQGPSAARNAGWSVARGELVAFLDADDAWHPAKLEVQANTFSRNTDLILLGTSASLGHSGDQNANVSTSKYVQIGPFSQLMRNRFSTSSVMLVRDVKYRFSDSLRFSEDNDLWCRLLLSNGGKAGVVEDALTYYFKPPRSRSGASGRFLSMYFGEQKAYFNMYREGMMSTLVYICAQSSSTLRFIVRICRVIYSDITRIVRKSLSGQFTDGG